MHFIAATAANAYDAIAAGEEVMKKEEDGSAAAETASLESIGWMKEGWTTTNGQATHSSNKRRRRTTTAKGSIKL